MFKILSTYSCWEKICKMQHLEGSGTTVLYMGRTVLKGCTQRFYYSSSKFSKFIQGTVSLLFFSSWPLSLC